MYKVDTIMNIAIALAQKAESKTLPNPRVGAVIFDDKGKILGKGWHKAFGKAHAEVDAINNTVKNSNTTKNKNMCVTLEPCNHFGKTPPCTDAIIKAGIKNVYVGTTDDCKTVCGEGIRKLKLAGIKVKVGILEKECRALNPGFHKYNAKKRPFIRIKVAISMNEMMGSTWFTSKAAREKVLKTRKNSDLVLTGVGTIKKDNPTFHSRRNLAILDQNLSLYEQYLKRSLNIFKLKGNIIIVTSDNKNLKSKIKALESKNIQIISTKLNKKGLIDLNILLKRLGSEFNYREIMVEAGPSVVKSLVIEAVKLVDKIDIYIAPVWLKEQNTLPKLPKLVVETQEMLENTLALEAHFDI